VQYHQLELGQSNDHSNDIVMHIVEAVIDENGDDMICSNVVRI
jgi:hypothetical protein